MLILEHEHVDLDPEILSAELYLLFLDLFEYKIRVHLHLIGQSNEQLRRDCQFERVFFGVLPRGSVHAFTLSFKLDLPRQMRIVALVGCMNGRNGDEAK